MSLKEIVLFLIKNITNKWLRCARNIFTIPIQCFMFCTERKVLIINILIEQQYLYYI